MEITKLRKQLYYLECDLEDNQQLLEFEKSDLEAEPDVYDHQVGVRNYSQLVTEIEEKIKIKKEEYKRNKSILHDQLSPKVSQDVTEYIIMRYL